MIEDIKHCSDQILKYKFMYTQSKSEDEESDEDEEFDIDVDDYLNTDKSKVIVITVPSLRLDAIAKAGLGISRK